jgi:hypothetical protein
MSPYQQKSSPHGSNLNPPSSSGTFVRIEAVHLLIHQNSKIYRKLLAPEPSKRQYFEKNRQEHFIKTIKLIEDAWIQFEFDFRVVTGDADNLSSNYLNSTNVNNSEINLLFHELFLDEMKTCSLYAENMGRFSVSPKKQSYRYTTTLSIAKSSSKFSSLKNQMMRLEIFDLDRTAWFIGEWKVKFQRADVEYDSWLKLGSQEIEDVQIHDSSDFVDDFDNLETEDFMRRASEATTLKIPSNFPSRTSSPLSRSSTVEEVDSCSSNSNLLNSNSRQVNSPANSIAASFEDLDLNDFSDISVKDDSLTLPPGPSSTFQDRLLFCRDEGLASSTWSDRKMSRSNSTISSLSRGSSPKPSQQDNVSTVDILHQVGTNFFSSKWGQIVTSSIKSDPNEQNLKTIYSTSTINLLGTRYQLQGIHSNVLLMETEEEKDEEDFEIKRISRFNNFSFLLKRLNPPNSTKHLILREVLLLKRSGPMISTRLKNWFESFPQWKVVEFTPATIKIIFDGILVEVKVYSLKPNESSHLNTPELFLIEILLTRQLNSSSSYLNAISESNAVFVELTAFIVQMEVLEAKKTPEIVLMETWNAHTEVEKLKQSESIPVVKYSVIPETSNYITFVYFWSDHLQGWLLQRLGIQGMLLSIHPLLDARMAIQINLSGSHLKASQDETGKIGNFTLISSRGQVYNFRVLQFQDLKEIIGRIRFSMLSRGHRGDNSSSSSVSGSHITTSTSSNNRRQGSLLQADKIYRGNPNMSNNNVSDQELERIRNQNMSVMDSFLEDFRTRFWFTYRRNFPKIEPSLFTTDLGWGCMLRTGQCLMAEALTRFYFGRNWRLWQIEENSGLGFDGAGDDGNNFDNRSNLNQTKIMKQFYLKISNQFIDHSKGEYSVHRLAIEGAKIGTPIGQWFGPSIIGKVLK